MLALLIAPLTGAELEMMAGNTITGEILDINDQGIRVTTSMGGSSATMLLRRHLIHRYRTNSDSPWEIVTPRPKVERPEPEPQPEPGRPVRPARQSMPLPDRGFFGWRGDGSGSFGDDLEPPTHWDDSRNVVWKRELPTWGSGSPTLFGDAILVTREPHTLLCIERSDGSIRWQVENSLPEVLGSGEDPGDAPPSGLRGWTMATPVTDGTHIWVAFAQGLITCFDASGNRVWAQPLNTVGQWGANLSASPLLWRNLLLQQSADGLIAFDKRTGQRLWRASFCCHLLGTGCFMDIDGRTHLLSTEGHLVRLDDGRQLSGRVVDRAWQNWGPSAVAHKNIGVFHLHGRSTKNETCIQAFRYSPTGEAEKIWEVIADPDYNYYTRMGNSPLIHQGIYYATTDGGLLVAIDVESGEVLYRHKFNRVNYTSMTQAGPYIYISGRNHMHIIAAGREFREVATFPHGFTRPEARPWLLISSPIFVGREMYVVDHTHIWRIQSR